MTLFRWGLAGSILALETLKLAMAPINRARDILVGQALQAGLVPLLLAKLDWRKAGSGSHQGEEEVLRLLSIAPCSAEHACVPDVSSLRAHSHLVKEHEAPAGYRFAAPICCGGQSRIPSLPVSSASMLYSVPSLQACFHKTHIPHVMCRSGQRAWSGCWQ